ncbi:MAG: site-specific DNA-methyltransferase, partial [Candidatus Hydrothermarchaeaceae archaeon]
LVFSKESFSRKRTKKENTISKEEFMELTKSVWTFPAERASKVGHPAPFPEELPHRLIQLYTFEGDVVLDPFIGSGTVGVTALKTNRHFVGYDNQPEYIELAGKRIRDIRDQIKITEYNKD